MKKLFFVLFPILLFAFYSCGGGSENSFRNTPEIRNASMIIGYANNVTGYLNRTGNWMRRNDSAIEDMFRIVESKQKPDFISLIISSSSSGTDKLSLTSPPLAMEEDDRRLFIESMVEYQDTFNSMFQQCMQLSRYIQSEAYDNDNYAGGIALTDSIRYQQQFLNEMRTMLYGRLNVLSENAEAIVLEDHPLKEPILAMKGDIQQIGELYDAFAAYCDNKLTSKELIEMYDAIDESIQKNKPAYGAILNEHTMSIRYDDFYTKCNETLYVYRTALIESKSQEEVPDKVFRTFTFYHNALISTYKSFFN